MIKNILLIFALLLSPLCFAQAQYVAADPIDKPGGSTCKVLVTEYRPGSGVMYFGDCGWTGLKGIAAYVHGWNQSNHIRVVRGNFSGGKAESFTKVTYINKIERTIMTYEENSYSKLNMKLYQLDDVITDATQAGMKIDHTIMTYVKLANYIDVFE
jgi:hypothetical protein